MHDIVPNCCRICLKKESELFSIYKPLKNVDKPPSEMLQEIAGIVLEDVYEKPALPKSICKRCLQSLNQLFRFRRKALETQRIISNYLLKENENDSLQLKRVVEEEKLETDYEFQYFTEVAVLADHETTLCDNGGMQNEEQVGNIIIDLKAEAEYVQENSCDAASVSKFNYDDDSTVSDSIINSPNANENDSVVEVQTNYSSEKTSNIPNDKNNGLKGGWNCDICGKSFSDHYEMVRHLRKHDMELAYVSNMCDERHNLPGYLTKYEVVHSDYRPHVCDVCNKAFKSIDNLIQHKCIHTHGRIHHCKCCNLDYQRRSDLRRHERSKTHQKTKESINNHKVVHSDHTPHVCDVCNATFKSRDSLRGHKSIHTNIRRHHCNYCNLDFLRRGTLKRHERSQNHQIAAGYLKKHSPDKQHVCEICGKTFTTLKHLKEHKSGHTTVRVLHCNYCNIDFQRRSSLNRHERRSKHHQKALRSVQKTQLDRSN